MIFLKFGIFKGFEVFKNIYNAQLAQNSLEKDLFELHLFEVFWGDDGLLRAVLDCVCFVAIFTANWTLVETQPRTENAADGILDGM